MKKSLLFFPFISMAFGAVVVNANNLDKHRMVASVTIDAPATKVWDIIKNHDDISWKPNITNINYGNSNIKGTERTLTLSNGGTITEQLTEYDEAHMMYKYKITNMSVINTINHNGQNEQIPALPIGNYTAKIMITSKGNKSEVKWIATYYRSSTNNNPPKELNEDAADKAVNDMMTTSLTALEKKIIPNATPLVDITHQCPVN